MIELFIQIWNMFSILFSFHSAFTPVVLSCERVYADVCVYATTSHNKNGELFFCISACFFLICICVLFYSCFCCCCLSQRAARMHVYVYSSIVRIERIFSFSAWLSTFFSLYDRCKQIHQHIVNNFVFWYIERALVTICCIPSTSYAWQHIHVVNSLFYCKSMAYTQLHFAYLCFGISLLFSDGVTRFFILSGVDYRWNHSFQHKQLPHIYSKRIRNCYNLHEYLLLKGFKLKR